MVSITNGERTTQNKAVPLAELLRLLDGSSVVETLRHDSVKRHTLPPLPQGTMHVGMIEYPGDRDIIVTGWTPARLWPSKLVERVGGQTFVVPLPPIVWRAQWNETSRKLGGLALTVAHPDERTPPSPESKLYKFPLSNVWGRAAVCWPTMTNEQMALGEIAHMGVDIFMGIPYNHELFGVAASQNSPHSDYLEYLGALAAKDDFPAEWLLPAGISVEEFHLKGAIPND